MFAPEVGSKRICGNYQVEQRPSRANSVNGGDRQGKILTSSTTGNGSPSESHVVVK